MSHRRNALIALLLPLMAACTSMPVSEPASRAADVPHDASAIMTLEDTLTEITPVVAGPVPLELASLDVVVPRSLIVSEADSILPAADIVWRGEQPGDRYVQVEGLFVSAAEVVAAGIEGERGVDMEIVVTRFHGLTEKARFLTGGNYAIQFDITLRDAETGAILNGPRHVEADLAAWGVTNRSTDPVTEREKVVIWISQILRNELSNPAL